MNAELPSHFPSEVLEQRAAEQRHRLHNSVEELRSSLVDLRSSVEENVRERLDINRFARRHLWKLATIASLTALAIGYGVAEVFVRD
ncbi:MAG TPA: hypothetical protein VMD98_13320 [Bryocella sp.]|nr:hypothetical protein [Bryocella sp.]